MQHHWHISIENVLIYGLSAILVINLLRLMAAGMSKSSSFESLGKGLGAIVS